MNEHDAYLALNLTAGIGPARSALLIEQFGSAAAVFERSAEELAALHGISRDLAQKILENAGKPLEDELSRIERGGVKVFARCDPEYPEQLRDLEDAPLCLYVCGTLPPELKSCSAAIVGSRRPTAYGVRMARHLAESALYSGWIVVSGLAIGIDAAAHEAVVESKGRTVAVLGGGLMNIQPREHIPLARKIVENGGAVVSEQPMMFPPTKYSFPMRNRIISGLTVATIVVEAGLHSGALITAAAALEQGKQVFAVPGNIDSELSMGCNNLIKTGQAGIITNFEDVLSGSDFLPGLAPEEKQDSGALLKETPETVFNDMAETAINESDRAILAFLRKNGDSGFDSISAETGIAANLLSRKLIALEIAHRLMRLGDGNYRILR